jgi:hypothetical protein
MGVIETLIPIKFSFLIGHLIISILALISRVFLSNLHKKEDNLVTGALANK